MTPILAKTMIQKGIIRQGTMLDAYENVKGISGQCDASQRISVAVVSAHSDGEWIFFETIGADKVKRRLRCDFVCSLDGMAVDRVAMAHRLTVDA